MINLSRKNEQNVIGLGRMFITPGALDALEESSQVASEYLNRHQLGDWGEVGSDDWEENDLSVKEGFRVLSSYRTAKGEKIWIITEADRSSTTVLLPSEY